MELDNRIPVGGKLHSISGGVLGDAKEIATQDGGNVEDKLVYLTTTINSNVVALEMNEETGEVIVSHSSEGSAFQSGQIEENGDLELIFNF